MILVADSGATKTAWILTDGEECEAFTTSGLNPYHIPPEEIGTVLAKELPPRIGAGVKELYFYGAGCTPEKISEMTGMLAGLFPAAHIEVDSDLFGACRGLCGNRSGIVCILGTGSNSCLYDGEEIVYNTPPLGYILGDEGSGAALGKEFIRECLRGYMPMELFYDFFTTHNLTPGDIIENVYRKPMANRFLAGFAPFIAQRRHIPEVRSMVKRTFRWFIGHNVMPYDAESENINFTGSIAFHFADILTETVGEMNLKMGVIMQSPIEGIAKYHTRKNDKVR